MNRKRLVRLAREAMGRHSSESWKGLGFVLHHGLRTARIALDLLDGLDVEIGFDRNLLFAAALFHDVGKPVEPHGRIGAAVAAEFLADECTPRQIGIIARIIREHNRRKRAKGEKGEKGAKGAKGAKGVKRCLRASRVVQDADVLDHFGAQCIWLACHWAAAHDESPRELLAFYRSSKNRRYIRSARRSLNFDLSRRLFDQRVAFERAFFQRLADEEGQRP